ncbi:MAG: phosphotransferase family protein [bacterium]|nr:phosphotransferase family protein [bacterium]
MAEEENTDPEVVRTSRDDQVLRQRLQDWLATQLPDGAAPQVSEISSPSSSGMSSETLLFDASWKGEGGATESGEFVGRMAPSEQDLPTFPSYDMSMQAGVLRLAGDYGVPVPAVRWLETDPGPLGAPFFVMERLRGRVPGDVPPYLAAGWVFEASDAERRQLQDATVEAIAKIHSIDLEQSDASFLEFDEPGDTPLRRHVDNQRSYYAWLTEGGRRSPLIERTFEWLDANWPNETSTVVTWGDSRIGNVMYAEDGFAPVAILDWEMAGLGTRELDLGWLCFMHTYFFQVLLEQAGAPGLPKFLLADDVAETYGRITGHTVEDLRWYLVYGGLRHAIIMSRIMERTVHFGQGEPTEDPDDRIPHRYTLANMLEGRF